MLLQVQLTLLLRLCTCVCLLLSAVCCAGLLKYEVVCSQLGVLGCIYLDLVARPGKVPSSGILYPVRCGRELPGEDLLLLLYWLLALSPSLS
jgi:hypothetical protein